MTVSDHSAIMAGDPKFHKLLHWEDFSIGISFFDWRVVSHNVVSTTRVAYTAADVSSKTQIPTDGRSSQRSTMPSPVNPLCGQPEWE